MSVPTPFEGLREVPIATQPLERLTAQLDAAAAERVDAARVPAVEALPRVWNVSSTARGGGVAELLPRCSPTRGARDSTRAGSCSRATPSSSP